MLEELYLDDSVLENEIRYETDQSIESLTFEHPLTMEEKEKVVYDLLDISSLKQVYFIGDVDVKTIDLVRFMLEFSKDIDDSEIEKTILVKDVSRIATEVIDMPFNNPDTWYMTFVNNGNSYDLITIPRYRMMESYFKEVISLLDGLSVCEKVLRIYDIVKLMESVDKNKQYEYLPDIIENGAANNNGCNVLFNALLSRTSINSYVGEVKSASGNRFITLVDIKDDKYFIDGMYLFDPSIINIGNGRYSDEERILNYDFFGIEIMDIDRTKADFKLEGILEALSIREHDFSNERSNHINNDKVSLEEAFHSDFFSIHNRCHSGSRLDLDKIVEVFSNVYEESDGEKEVSYTSLIRDTYSDRHNELFNNSDDIIGIKTAK